MKILEVLRSVFFSSIIVKSIYSENYMRDFRFAVLKNVRRHYDLRFETGAVAMIIDEWASKILKIKKVRQY